MARKPSKVAQDFRDVFGSAEGRRVLAHIMAHCKVFTPILPGPDKDFELGARNVALMIASYLAYRPDEFVRLAQDHNEALNYE